MGRAASDSAGRGHAIDAALARALRGEPASWPLDARGNREIALVLDRIGYHAIAGLLAAHPEALADWPEGLRHGLRRLALAGAMWEARHRSLVAPLIEALAGAGVTALVLKGTALAHDVYTHPAERIRADTDLLVTPADLPRARAVLRASGFVPDPLDSAMPEALRRQEAWEHACPDGTAHEIDLHAHLFNAPALAHALPRADLLAHAVPLARLSPSARTLDRAAMLLHLAMHRAVHRVSPYFFAGEGHRGDDRLIWLVDIARVAQAMDAAQWHRLLALAQAAGASAVCHEALATAADRLGARLPGAMMDQLARRGAQAGASAYLLRSGAAGRAWRNLRAVPAPSRPAWLAARLFPPAAFMRAKYHGLARWPLPALHLRRIWELWRAG